MATTTSPMSPAPERPAPQPRPRTPARPASRRAIRRVTLVVHLVSAGAWIGIDVIVAVLVCTGRFAGDAATRGLAYQALGSFVVWPMLTSGLVCLASGLVLGLATRWGLLRYWWVVVKLVLNLALCTLILVLLRPGMPDVRAYGRHLSAGTPADGSMSTLFFPPAVSLTVLTLATVLAVYKPWGRTARRRFSDPRKPNVPR